MSKKKVVIIGAVQYRAGNHHSSGKSKGRNNPATDPLVIPAEEDVIQLTDCGPCGENWRDLANASGAACGLVILEQL
jgi:hypothetical protein